MYNKYYRDVTKQKQMRNNFESELIKRRGEKIMKAKKFFAKTITKASALALVGATALSVGAPVHAKTITYKDCVIEIIKPEDCFPNINKPDTDCPEVDVPEVDVPEVDVPEVDVPEVDVPEVDVPGTDKPGVDVPETETPGTETPDTDVSSQTAYENRVLELVNEERAKQGLKALEMDESVRNVARLKSEDMRKNNYFDHTSPTYGSPFDMLKQFGISYSSAGENIAQGYRTPEEVVEGWMNSPGHRANILNESFTHLGVGYDSNGHYWTQMFIGK